MDIAPVACTLAAVIPEIVNTGSELLLGRIVNLHQQWLCSRLADMGHAVSRQVAVPDAPADIEAGVREALSRADLVITTGGLGPTSDDITRERIAGLLGLELRHDPEVEAQIRGYFVSRGRPVPDRTRLEAMVPAGARVLRNRHGTAPGLAMRLAPNPFREGGTTSWLVMLPGPPRELRPMFDEAVAPLIRREFPVESEFACRTLKTTGLGESYMEELVAGPLAHLTAAGMELGYCARVGEVDVRFVARGTCAAARVAEAEAIVRRLAAVHVFGEQDDTLELAVVREMTSRGRTLALAESCTGGHVANRVTNVPGASAVLRAGYVTYANEAKTAMLGVPEALIAAHGAVSEPVARAMAEGALRISGADFAVAITGIAGPGGGSESKPVGTVHVAVSGPGGVETFHHINRFDRETFKYITAQQALARLLRRVREGG